MGDITLLLNNEGSISSIYTLLLNCFFRIYLIFFINIYVFSLGPVLSSILHSNVFVWCLSKNILITKLELDCCVFQRAIQLQKVEYLQSSLISKGSKKFSILSRPDHNFKWHKWVFTGVFSYHALSSVYLNVFESNIILSNSIWL